MDTEPIPGITDDPVLRLIYEGRATTLHDAEEIYLNDSLSLIEELIASPLGNEALQKHPLMQLLASHGSRGWEDSLL